MRYATIAAAVAMLAATSVEAAAPMPEFKPTGLPWWIADNVDKCAPTAQVMATLRESDGEPLYWAPIATLSGIGVVGQLWGTPTGDVDGSGNGWMLVVHTANGVTCLVSKGHSLPKWAAHIDGRPA